MVFSGTIISHLDGFLSFLKHRKKSTKGIMMVWQVVIWIFCRVMNNKKNSGKPIVFGDVLERIKCISWKWLLAKKVNSHCLY
jgi:hypothetical protein